MKKRINTKLLLILICLQFLSLRAMAACDEQQAANDDVNDTKAIGGEVVALEFLQSYSPLRHQIPSGMCKYGCLYYRKSTNGSYWNAVTSSRVYYDDNFHASSSDSQYIYKNPYGKDFYTALTEAQAEWLAKRPIRWYMNAYYVTYGQACEVGDDAPLMDGGTGVPGSDIVKDPSEPVSVENPFGKYGQPLNQISEKTIQNALEGTLECDPTYEVEYNSQFSGKKCIAIDPATGEPVNPKEGNPTAGVVGGCADGEFEANIREADNPARYTVDCIRSDNYRALTGGDTPSHTYSGGLQGTEGSGGGMGEEDCCTKPEDNIQACTIPGGSSSSPSNCPDTATVTSACAARAAPSTCSCSGDAAGYYQCSYGMIKFYTYNQCTTTCSCKAGETPCPEPCGDAGLPPCPDEEGGEGTCPPPLVTATVGGGSSSNCVCPEGSTERPDPEFGCECPEGQRFDSEYSCVGEGSGVDDGRPDCQGDVRDFMECHCENWHSGCDGYKGDGAGGTGDSGDGTGSDGSGGLDATEMTGAVKDGVTEGVGDALDGAFSGGTVSGNGALLDGLTMQAIMSDSEVQVEVDKFKQLFDSFKEEFTSLFTVNISASSSGDLCWRANALGRVIEACLDPYIGALQYLGNLFYAAFSLLAPFFIFRK